VERKRTIKESMKYGVGYLKDKRILRYLGGPKLLKLEIKGGYHNKYQ
jgi:hypothetical protein